MNVTVINTAQSAVSCGVCGLFKCSSCTPTSLTLAWLLAPPAGNAGPCCSQFLSVIGPGGLAVEAPGGQVEGGIRRRRHGGEKEAVWQLRTGPTEEPALEAATCTGELSRQDAFGGPNRMKPKCLQC